MREFYLKNELGETYNINDLTNMACVLKNEIGYSTKYEYAQSNNYFFEKSAVLNQKGIELEITFLTNAYKTFQNFIKFIESSKKIFLLNGIKIENKMKYYYRELKVSKIEKIYESLDLIKCSLSLDFLSLWYEEKNKIITIENLENEIIWDFDWDSVFISENTNIIFENNGHVEAPFLLELSGTLINPVISILQNEKKINELNLSLNLEVEEKLLLSTRDTDIYIYKQLSNGNLENIFNNLDLNKTNFFKFPIGTSIMRINADTEITNGKLTIYTEYKTI